VLCSTITCVTDFICSLNGYLTSDYQLHSYLLFIVPS